MKQQKGGITPGNPEELPMSSAKGNMPKPIAMIGIQANELRWMRLLLLLLRHPEPGKAELARRALLYLSEPPENADPAADASLDYTG
jgi:hypothetical protein